MHRMHRTRFLSCFALVTTVTAAGCASGGTSRAESPTTASAEAKANAESQNVAGVDVTVRIDNWGGPARISSEVTPVRVTIRNESGVPLAIRYREFYLVDADGKAYRALPVYDVDGLVEADGAALEDDKLELAARRALAFKFAPYYAKYDPDVDVYTGTFETDADYLTTYGPELEVRALPTKTMWRAALPEGVLQPGGYLDGYLYFQHLPDGADASFRATFPQAASQGAAVANMSIPVQD